MIYNRILLEIANFCETCPSHELCPEEECVLYRIEKMILRGKCMDINEIVNEYYNSVVDLEKFLKYRNSLSEDDRKREQSPFVQSILECFEEYYEKQCMPWRLIKGDVKDEMYKIFTASDFNKILPYLNAGDMLTDTLISYLEDDLTDYYQKKGYDVTDDKIKDEIIDKAFDLHFQDEIDSTIFSTDTITLHKIAKRMNIVCNELYEYFQSKKFESTDEVQI